MIEELRYKLKKLAVKYNNSLAQLNELFYMTKDYIIINSKQKKVNDYYDKLAMNYIINSLEKHKGLRFVEDLENSRYERKINLSEKKYLNQSKKELENLVNNFISYNNLVKREKIKFSYN